MLKHILGSPATTKKFVSSEGEDYRSFPWQLSQESSLKDLQAIKHLLKTCAGPILLVLEVLARTACWK